MPIRSVSYVLSENYEILSIADEFVELHHVNGTPFQPAEVWGKEIWSHIQQNQLAKTYQALFVRARRRPVSLPFRLDTERELCLWQLEAEPYQEHLLVTFHKLATKQRPRLAYPNGFAKPPIPLTFCGWCNRVTKPGQQPQWSDVEEAEYLEVLRAVSRSSVRVSLCDACTSALVRSHEPKCFEHLSLCMPVEPANVGPTLHRQKV